jgi:hypothetical protein
VQKLVPECIETSFLPEEANRRLRLSRSVCVAQFEIKKWTCVSLVTGWTVRGSNPGRSEIFRTRPDRPWGPPSHLYNGYRVFPGGKAAGALY